MQKKRKRKQGWIRFGRLFVLVLAVPLLARLLWHCALFLGQAGESVAILSAVIAMPEGGLPLLQERFRAEIYNPEGNHATGDTEQGKPLPPPEPKIEEPLQEESRSGETAPDPIPAEFAAPIISEDFSGRDNPALVAFGAGLIRNETSFEPEELEEILQTPHSLTFTEDGEPQVLIVHTHATEAFEKYDASQYDTRNTWRDTDNENNMVAVGDMFAKVLEENGIAVLHDDTQHDYPSYNGSYDRSAVTIEEYLEEYPSIKVVLDVHRDAMQREESIVKPVAEIDGKKAAQIMIISACDNGEMGVPQWRENLRFAAALQDQMETLAPGLTRPIYLCYRKYNMNLTTGSLLLEFGSNANTLDEAVYAASLSAQALADLIWLNTTEEVEAEPEAEVEAMADAEPETEAESEFEIETEQTGSEEE